MQNYEIQHSFSGESSCLTELTHEYRFFADDLGDAGHVARGT